MTARRKEMSRERGRSSGYTLVEVLVALIVLSIGMLGIAALYLESLRASRSALLRTEAVTLAADLADRIRSNNSVPDVYVNAPNATATFDLAEWQANVATTLPGGAGVVRYSASPGPGVPPVYTITVNWIEAGEATASSYELRVEI
jgi:type IV pilus assembly protein PilV